MLFDASELVGLVETTSDLNWKNLVSQKSHLLGSLEEIPQRSAWYLAQLVSNVFQEVSPPCSTASTTQNHLLKPHAALSQVLNLSHRSAGQNSTEEIRAPHIVFVFNLRVSASVRKSSVTGYDLLTVWQGFTSEHFILRNRGCIARTGYRSGNIAVYWFSPGGH